MHAAEPAAEKIETPPVPAQVATIDHDLATARKAPSAKDAITTDIGVVREFVAWFDAGGALRKASYVQDGALRHESYFGGDAGKERAIFAIERGKSVSEKQPGDFEIRSWFREDGTLSAATYQRAGETEPVKPGTPLFAAEADLAALQTQVTLLLTETLRLPAKAPAASAK